MKIVARKFVEIGGSIFDLTQFQSLISKETTGGFIITFQFEGGNPTVFCETEEQRDTAIDDFVQILNEFYGVLDDPLAPPKGFIDLTTLTSNPAESNVMLVNVSEIKSIEDHRTYTNIGTANGIYAYNETYDVVIERIKEAMR